jgi:hypothetical protein
MVFIMVIFYQLKLVDLGAPFRVIAQMVQLQCQSPIFQNCQGLFVTVQPLPITFGNFFQS